MGSYIYHGLWLLICATFFSFTNNFFPTVNKLNVAQNSFNDINITSHYTLWIFLLWYMNNNSINGNNIFCQLHSWLMSLSMYGVINTDRRTVGTWVQNLTNEPAAFYVLLHLFSYICYLLMKMLQTTHTLLKPILPLNIKSVHHTNAIKVHVLQKF